jgi:hypothetical protein
VADGRVYVPTETGDLFVLKHEAKPFAHDAEDERATGTDAADAADAADANREGMKAVQDKVLVRKAEFPHALRSPPTAVNGVLYVATETTLYGIGTKQE